MPSTLFGRASTRHASPEDRQLIRRINELYEEGDELSENGDAVSAQECYRRAAALRDQLGHRPSLASGLLHSGVRALHTGWRIGAFVAPQLVAAASDLGRAAVSRAHRYWNQRR